ncbi:glycosyltransferase [Candidatus Peregrinibacteria bacterium]|nr:glycosyltransferase [Candidatus Peregrinibacteria bacterium]
MPEVNIYMPAYEAQKAHIQEAVDSVLSQTVTDWTLLIQEDCSKKEDVESHIEKYMSDERITFRKNERNVGIGPNWNACLDFGDCEYIAYLFHDDLWGPKYLEKALEILKSNPAVGFVSMNHSYLLDGDGIDTKIYDEVQRFVKKNIHEGKHNGKELLIWWAQQGLRPNIIGEPSFVVLRRDLIEEVGNFHETMPQFLDSEYWIRCLQKTNWWYLTEDLGSFRVHSEAASAKNEVDGRGKFDRFECFRMLLKTIPKEDKPQIQESFEKAFDDMIKKYIERKRSGKVIITKGSGKMKQFALRHPIFICKALMRNAKTIDNS